jgi:DNA polymerase-3 subunit delta'
VSRAPTGEGLPESDALAGVPHPRLAHALVGHAQAEAALLESFKSCRLAHAWLIGGPRGIGKATLAWRFARFVLARPDPASAAVQAARDLSIPPEHPAARQVAALAHPDLALLRPQKLGSKILVDDVRAALKLFQMMPGFGGWRVCIIDAADDLNASSANALLKAIEEPPARSLFLIVAHRPGGVLPTIRSRSRTLLLKALDAPDVAKIIRGLGDPWSEFAVDDVASAARRARGSVQEAIVRLDPDSGPALAQIEAVLESLPDFDWSEAHRVAGLVNRKAGAANFKALTTAIFDWMEARLIAHAGDAPGRLAPIAEAWEKISAATRDTEDYNLDKRLYVLTTFAELAAAARRL